MSRFDEHLFGRVAIFNGYLRHEELQECLALQRAMDPAKRRPIGEILLERGYLSEEQLVEILEIRRKKLRKMLVKSGEVVDTERSFGRHAIDLGYLNTQQLEAALLEQNRLRRLNLQLCLGDIMISLGYLNVDQVLEILASQNNRILVCGECESHFTVRSYRGDEIYFCSHCESPLEIPRFLDTVATDAVIGSDHRTEPS